MPCPFARPMRVEQRRRCLYSCSAAGLRALCWPPWGHGWRATAVCALRRCCAVGWPAGRGRGPSLPSVSSSIKFPWLPCHVREQEEGKEEDDANYIIVTGSFNLRRFFVLNPFQFVPVALVSCRRDLRSRVISFYITCLWIYFIKILIVSIIN